jgi:hypothetical protein
MDEHALMPEGSAGPRGAIATERCSAPQTPAMVQSSFAGC